MRSHLRRRPARTTKPLAAAASGTVIVLAAAVAGCSDSARSAGGESDTIVMSAETNPGDPLADMLNLFADELEATIGDEYQIERYLGGAIGDEVAQLEALRSGQTDVVVVGSDISTLEPKFGIMELPFLFSSREEVTAFLDGEFGQEMSDSLEESANLRVLSYGENGFRHITNNARPITVPADLEGIKLRVPEVPARVTTFSTLGAVPTPMSINEVYIALDQGVLDGQENPLKVIDAFSFQEKQQYLSLSAHVYSPASLTINADRWNSFSPEIQEKIEAAADKAAEGSRELGIEADKELLAQFESQGVEINEIDTAAFQEAVRPIWEELKGDIDVDFVDRVLKEYGP